MIIPTTDPTLAMVRENLYTSVVSDVLDRRGRNQQFLPPTLTPLDPTAKIAGRAMRVVVNDLYGPTKKPFGLLTEALDQLEKDEIYMSSSITQPMAQWGEILAATAQQKGAVGAVVNGYYRDTRQILEREFPVWGLGSYGADSFIRSLVSDFRVPIMIGPVRVTPGDLILADIDGVVVIPQDVEDDVLRIASDQGGHRKHCLERNRQRGHRHRCFHPTWGALAPGPNWKSVKPGEREKCENNENPLRGTLR